MSDLDDLLEIARTAPEKGHLFYDGFLNSDLHVPVRRADGQPASWSALGMRDKFFPLFLPHDKEKVVPVFDSRERLREWAGEQPLDFVEMRGHQIVRLVATDVSVALNLGTEHAYLFTAELLGKIRNALRPPTSH